MTKLDVEQQKNMRDAMTDDSRDVVVAPQVPRREGCATFTVRYKTCHEDLSRRGRSLYLTKVAQNRLKLRKGDVKNAFLQGKDTVQDVELETNLSHCL